MGVTIDVDTTSFESASDVFYDVNNEAVDATLKASNGADGGAGMAGSDASGVEWAKQYDDAANQAIQAGCSLGDVLGHIGDMLAKTGTNHADADTSSTMGGPPSYPGSGSSKGSESLSAPAPPSANGTSGNEPHGWFLVADLMSWVWPNGHQDQLRSVGSAWIAAGGDLQFNSYNLTPAISQLQAQTSPEVAAAIKTCTDVQTHMNDLGSAFNGLGDACNQYAQHLDDAHRDVLAELKSLLEWTAGIEIAGGVFAFFTAGISEAAAQAAEAARCALAATRIGEILSKLAEVTRTVVALIGRFVAKIGEIAGKLGKFAKDTWDAVLEKIASKLPTRAAKIPKVDDPKLNNIVNNVYKGVANPNRVGDGTTMDAIRSELATGAKTGNKMHLTKGRETVRALENWLRKNPGASAADRTAAETLKQQLTDALNGK